jgi:multisubunit Na+/H+ antiporter MnhG subunit
MIGNTIKPPVQVSPIQYDLGNEYVLLINVFAVLVSILAMIYWVKLYRRLYKSDKKQVRGWLWLFVAALGILLFNISSIYMVFVTSPVYELIQVIGRTLIGISMTVGAYLLYSPMKKGLLYKFVPVTPVTEKESNMKSILTEIVKKGQSYLIDEERPIKSNEIFVNLVTHGAQGLYITRRFPQEIRNAYNLKLTPIIWLTREKTEENHIDPTDLVELSYTIKEFIKKTSDGVILVDGLEYLITQNEYKEILKFVQSLKDSIATSLSRLIVPLDHSTLDEQQFHLLKREMNALETGIRGII